MNAIIPRESHFRVSLFLRESRRWFSHKELNFFLFAWSSWEILLRRNFQAYANIWNFVVSSTLAGEKKKQKKP